MLFIIYFTGAIAAYFVCRWNFINEVHDGNMDEYTTGIGLCYCVFSIVLGCIGKHSDKVNRNVADNPSRQFKQPCQMVRPLLYIASLLIGIAAWIESRQEVDFK
jgi:hypothetical protein